MDIDDEIREAKEQLAKLEKQKEAQSEPFPKEAVMYAYIDKERLYQVGREIGLTKDSIGNFRYAQEYKITVHVDKDGNVTPLSVE